MDVYLTIRLHLVPRLRMRGAVSLSPMHRHTLIKHRDNFIFTLPQYLQANAGIVSQIRLRPLPSTSSNVLPSNATLYTMR
jgi:hypothetical protein